MKAYHVYLLRHGITKANQDGCYVGRIDLPLSDDGEDKLREMKQKYAYPYADLFFSSPMKRCVRTLEILYPEAKPTIVEDLQECDFGDYEGKTLNELKDDETYKKWVLGNIPAAPNGENSKDFATRCCLAFEKIIGTLMKSGESTAVIMAHGGTIMSILGNFAFPRKPMYEWLTGNGMGYELVITPQLFMSGRVVEVAGAVPFVDDELELAGVKGLVDDFKHEAENIDK